MATLYTHQDQNIRRTWFLMAAFLVVVIGLGYFISYYYHNPGILYIAIAFSIVMNIGSFWYSDRITLAVSHAVPADKATYPDLFRAAENLAITAGLPSPKLYVISDPSPNAFATGRDKDHAAIAVTTGLLAILNKTELEGVLAHELSHIGNRDILLSTVVVVLVGFISLIAHIFTRNMFWGSGKREERDNGILIALGILFTILSPVIATLIQLAISRKREFLADASGALLTRYPEGLANALRKIAAANIPMQNPNPATAHLYIANPFGSAGKKVVALFATHPPVEERIAALVGNR